MEVRQSGGWRWDEQEDGGETSRRVEVRQSGGWWWDSQEDGGQMFSHFFTSLVQVMTSIPLVADGKLSTEPGAFNGGR